MNRPPRHWWKKLWWDNSFAVRGSVRPHSIAALRLESLERRVTPSGNALPLTFSPLAGQFSQPQSTPDLGSQASGVLGLSGASAYTFTVTDAMGSGRLSAEVTATGGTLVPRLTLSDPDGRPLLESDDGRIVQYVRPGTYTLVVSAQAGTGSFQLATEFAAAGPLNAPLTAGASPYAVVAGDLTNDGVADLVVANQRDNTVSVFVGIGGGYFRAPQTFDVGALPFSVEIADLNGDGRLDVVTADKFDSTVSVLLGNGDGTFQTRTAYHVGIRPGGVTVADVSGDGKSDLVVSNYGDGTVSVLVGNGDGTFQPQQVIATGGSPVKVSVADVTGDGIPDLIVPDYGASTVGVLAGNGDGTFRAQQSFAAGAGPYSVVVGDINGDGKPDIVTANYSDNSVSVLLGNGDGTYQPHRDYAVGAVPYSLALADVNGDGKPDVVTANSGDNTVSVLRGNGDGTFQPQRAFNAGKSPRAVAVADVTGDGAPEIVVANRGDDTVSVLLGNGDGSFQAQPGLAAPSLRPSSVAVADLTGSDRADLVTANFGDNSVSVFLRNPDGTFQTRQTFTVGTSPAAVAVADVNGDGIPDIATANYGSGSVSVLLGNGDGTYRPHRDFLVGPSPQSIAVADVTGDGIPDLVVPNKSANGVSVLAGLGDGTFRPAQDFAAANSARVARVADVNRDGVPDLVTAGFSSVAVLLGEGGGTFGAPQVYPTTGNTFALTIADLNGDGVPDVATTNAAGGSVGVFLGNGDGTFRPETDFAAGAIPYSVAVADINGDGVPDLVTANNGDATVSVLIGEGGGTFRPPQAYSVGAGVSSVAVTDLDGDGKPDIAATNFGDNTVSILSGNGDGTFGNRRTLTPGTDLHSVAAGDLTGDGKPDLVTTDRLQNTVLVQVGNGDGTFQGGRSFAVGDQPVSVAVADLNGDGRSDLVTTNSGSGGLSVLLGNGDGTFQPQVSYATGRSPRGLAVADLNGDGATDLVIANYSDDTVSVLLGNGDGTFQPQQIVAVGSRPYSVAVADLNGDGKPDLVVGNVGEGTVSVLFGNGNGSFQPQRTFAVGRQPFSLAVADFTGDGRPDIATANYADDTASVLVNTGTGTFLTQQVFAVGAAPTAVTAADLTGADRSDLVTTNRGDNTLSVLFETGTGTFQPAQTFAAGQDPVLTAIADLNGDGIPDLATVGDQGSAIDVELGTGTGAFHPAAGLGGLGAFNTPILADLNGDGTDDTVILDSAGNILFRRGLAGAVNSFAPPVILNGAAAIGENRPARAVAVIHTPTGLVLAVADTGYDSGLSSAGRFVDTVSLYRVAANGSVSRVTAFPTALLPTNIAAADLTGDGLDDIVVADALDNSAQIAFQRPDGTFDAPVTRLVGGVPAGISFEDVNGTGRLDVVVGNQSSGTVTVLFNDAAHAFTTAHTFRAGLGFSVLSQGPTGTTLTSLDQSVSLAVGAFTGTDRNDLVVVNNGAHSFTVLPNDGNGGFAPPQRALTTSTSSSRLINDRPGPVVTADFHGTDGLDSRRAATADLAVLMEGRDEVWIYTNNGDGTFTLGQQIKVGSQSTGLSVVAGSGPGLFDLLVGTAFGDVLRLVGNGDGTFTPPPPLTGDRVPLDVLESRGTPVVLVANQSTNTVTVQMSTATTVNPAPNVMVQTFAPVATVPTTPDALAPGAVYWVQLEGAAGMYDAVVVASGSNSVLVYKTLTVDRTGQPTFAAPVSYPVGTDPVSLTVGYFNGSPVPSLLVVNNGSNDISVIFGDSVNGTWVGRSGPRLNSGGTGPISVALEPVGGSNVPALVVTNAGSGTITALPGIGQNGVGTGFFRDNAPMTVAVPAAPIGPLTADYLPTAQGIYRFEPTAMAVTQVFASGALTALSVTATGLVVAGFAGGTLGVLQDTGAGSLAIAQTFGDARLTTLSGLQAIVTPDGSTEVFASGAGTSGSVFAFTLAVIGGDPFPVTPEPGTGDNPFSFTIQQGVAIVDPTPLSQPGPTIDVESVGSTGTFFAAVLTCTGASGTGSAGLTDSVNDSFAADVSTNIAALVAVLITGGSVSESDPTDPDSENAEAGPLPLNDFITGIEDALDAVRKQIREREGVEEVAPPAPEAETDLDLIGWLLVAPQPVSRGAVHPEAPRAGRANAGVPEEVAALLGDSELRPEAAGQWHWVWLPVLLSCAWLWLDERAVAARRRDDREEVYSGSGSPIDIVR